MQFPLALQVAIRVEKSGELGTTHFSCPNFSEAKSRSVLSFTLFTRAVESESREVGKSLKIG